MTQNYEDLANAIILRAVKDYRKARRVLSKYPLDPKADNNRKSIERFFRSDYFGILSNLDTERIIKRLNQEVTG